MTRHRVLVVDDEPECEVAPGPVPGARSAPEDGGSSEFRTDN